MKKKLLCMTVAATAGLMMTSVQAEEIALFDYVCNIDGVSAGLGDTLPPTMDVSGFDDVAGLGEIVITHAGAGAHTVICFVDHEIDQSLNGFANEAGAIGGGGLQAGMSWEIDDPDFGDILDNVFVSTENTESLLDNTNSVPASAVNDVSMAIGFDFVLTAAETAVNTFFLDIVNNATGFFLRQFDPDSIHDEVNAPNELYFWASNRISGGGGPVPVPEPGTIGLLGLGLLGIASMRRRRQPKLTS